MTDYEELLRQAAEKRGWTIDLHDNRISVGGVPYRMKNGASGACQVSVDTEGDERRMRTPEKVQNAPHAARLSGVAGGCAYRSTGEQVGNVLWTDNANECVISIKRDEGEYMNAWHGLLVYATQVAGEVGATERERNKRPFRFEIVGESDRDTSSWRQRESQQKVGIVGLGGVGLWILDMMSKTDVAEITIWDGDDIEDRNLLRAPGWASNDAIGKSKAEYFGGLYQGVRTGISIAAEYWNPDGPADAFQGLSFVFVAVDKVNIRTALCEHLEQVGVPFIDVGMGLQRREGRVRGSCQVFFSGKDPSRWHAGIPTAEGAGHQDYYQLQLADLGALNAALAVGRWRRHIAQYAEKEEEWLIRYTIDNNDLLKRSEAS